MKFDVKSLALSLGICVFGFFMILGIWFSATGFGKPIVDLMVSFYANILHFSYNPIVSVWNNLTANFLSVFLLSLFTGIDGTIIGFLFASLYNLLLKKDK